MSTDLEISAGIHHVTAIASDPQRNIDFYGGLLGLRLVKVTVNFDDPGTYHLYYGDAGGNPGTILTFFPWPDVAAGRAGSGETVETTFLAPRGSLSHWEKRLGEAGAKMEGIAKRFGQDVLLFRDPDGMGLGLAEAEAGGATGNTLLGFHSVTLSVAGDEDSARVLAEGLGFATAGSEESRFRYRAAGSSAGTSEIGRYVDILCQPERARARLGAGSVHHVAFRASDVERQETMRTGLLGRGLNVTPMVDRNYFKSVYFREPGGVLFEIATDPPGFAVDEPADQLGTHLMLPPQYEKMRTRLREHLPKLRLLGGGTLP